MNSSRRIRVRVDASSIRLEVQSSWNSVCRPSPTRASRHRIRVRVSIIHPSRKVIEFGSESVAKSILHRNPVDIEFCWPAPGTRVYDPSKSSRHRTMIRVRVSGPVYHPSENSSRIRVRVSGPVYPPGPGPFTVANIISNYRNSDAIHFGSPEQPRPSVSKAQPISVIHPNPVTVVIEFRLSIIHQPGPRFAHRSLHPPSESEGTPSTDLVNENILRFRLSLGLSHALELL